MKQASGFLILFLFIFGPFLKINGVVIHLPYYVMAGLAIVGFLGWVRERELLKAGTLMLCSLVLLLVYGVFVGYLNRYFDKEFYVQVLVGLLVLPAGLGIAVLYSLLFRDKAGEYVLWHFFWAGVLHSLIMIVAFSSETVSSFLYSYIPLSEKGEKFVEMRIRSPGFTSGGGDVLSGLHAVSVVIGFYLALRSWHVWTLLKKLVVVAGFYILVASLALAARTGYVIILGLMPVLFIVLQWRAQARFSFTFLVRGFTAFLFVAGFAFLTFSTLLDVLGEERAYKRSAELMESYGISGTDDKPSDSDERREDEESENREIRSITALKKMYFLPVTGSELVLGTGDLGRNETRGYLPSDVGYVRAINGFGLIGAFLMYMPFIWLGMIIFRRDRLGLPQVALVLCAASILAMNLKVFYFWGMRDIFKILVVMLFLQVISKFGDGRTVLSGLWANKR